MSEKELYTKMDNFVNVIRQDSKFKKGIIIALSTLLLSTLVFAGMLIGKNSASDAAWKIVNAKVDKMDEKLDDIYSKVIEDVIIMKQDISKNSTEIKNLAKSK